jgi:hypothetical protein
MFALKNGAAQTMFLASWAARGILTSLHIIDFSTFGDFG